MAGTSTYNQETADAICERLMEGESLRSICLGDDMPSLSTVMKWRVDNEAFSEQYAHARETQADVLADQVVHIADTATDPHLARLQMDARKWYAGKMKSKLYGDKQQVEHSGGVSLTQALDVLPD